MIIAQTLEPATGFTDAGFPMLALSEICNKRHDQKQQRTTPGVTTIPEVLLPLRFL